MIGEAANQIQSLFRLDFLFSGLEVSSTVVFATRTVALLLLGGGLMWMLFQVLLKALDCLQTLLTCLKPLPKSFWLLLLLAVPLSPQSLAATWIAYILLTLLLISVMATILVAVVVWKYGVDQALRLLRGLRPATDEAAATDSHRVDPNPAKCEAIPLGVPDQDRPGGWKSRVG
ncbi:MAG: hypothetical protein AB1646_13435 [Thermodesulfobacteriota bacterium]